MREIRQRKLLPWFRLGCVVVGLLAMYFVFQRINLRELVHALHSAQAVWLLAAVLVYGIAFLPAAWRWHLALRLTGCTVHPGATTRMSLIGHFFYTVFFGVAGGDFAKSALYARWYRLPLPEILAAAPLDRLMGLGGLVIFVALAFGLAGAKGGFSTLAPSSVHLPLGWIALLVVVVAVVTLGLLRKGQNSTMGRMLRAFMSGSRRLIVSWPVAWQGLMSGFLVQVAFAANLAFSLQAVSHTPLPWGRLAWTFPVISAVSAVPFTIAGLGFREGAAMALLGLYGVSPADAVAASLLTLAARLIWAAVGGLLLWIEQRGQLAQRIIPKTISVVIPAFNEADALEQTLRNAQALPEVCEIIVVDGGSSDHTREVARAPGCLVLESATDRGRQICLGAAHARGDVILLMRADTWLPPEAGRRILDCLRDTRVVGGGFWKTFRDGSPLLIGARLKCLLRLYVGRRVLIDQGFFIRRESLEAAGGMPDQPVMQEFELSSRLRRIGRLALADATTSTSARRFTKRGVVRTYWLMWVVAWRYHLGASPEELHRLYDDSEPGGSRNRVASGQV